MNSRPRMILLHGAAVAANGGAWLFMAPSETGKSTLSRRLSPYAHILVCLLYTSPSPRDS